MHIQAETRGAVTLLHLRGEFDTWYCTHLEREIERLCAGDPPLVGISLRLVSFLNSTALGALIKAHKKVHEHGGRLGILRPSPAARAIFERLGIERVLRVFGDELQGLAYLTAEPEPVDLEGGDPPSDLDPGALLFSPEDLPRLQHYLPEREAKNPRHGHAFGERWSGVGRLLRLDRSELTFGWSGGETDLSTFEMAQLLARGTHHRIKFRLPLERRFLEARVRIEAVEEGQADEGREVRVRAVLEELDSADRRDLSRFIDSVALLRRELG